MKLIRARFGDDVDNAARSPAYLGGVSVCLDVDLLDRFDGGPHSDGADDTFVVIQAVH
jgi:hypothetical protein